MAREDFLDAVQEELENITCPVCGGTGSCMDVWNENEHDCYTCHGTGHVDPKETKRSHA